MAHLRTITNQEYLRCCEGAQTLMHRKVFRLPNGLILKAFYIKRPFSSARIRPYSVRFLNNAEKLLQAGIPTVEVVDIFKVLGAGMSAVVYRELPGETLRDYLQETSISEQIAADLGAFFGELHEKGVYFRSIHLNNILRLSNGRLGLIDVADMKIHRSPLGIRKRLRNFRHTTRSEADRLLLAGVREPFFNAYRNRSRLSGQEEKRIQRHLALLWRESA